MHDRPTSCPAPSGIISSVSSCGGRAGSSQSRAVRCASHWAFVGRTSVGYMRVEQTCVERASSGGESAGGGGISEGLGRAERPARAGGRAGDGCRRWLAERFSPLSCIPHRRHWRRWSCASAPATHPSRSPGQGPRLPALPSPSRQRKHAQWEQQQPSGGKKPLAATNRSRTRLNRIDTKHG